MYQLNLDGSNQLDGNGKPVETYDQATISSLAQVFTGVRSQKGRSQKGQVSHLAQSNAPTLDSDVKRFASIKYSTKTERNQNIANAFYQRRAYANGDCAGV